MFTPFVSFVTRPSLALRSGILSLVIGVSGLQGCGVAGTHAGIATVPQPEPTEQDVGKWFAYYRDQFDAYEGVVVAPSGPAAATQGFQQAAAYWSRKVSQARTNTYLLIGGLSLGSTLLIILLASAGSGYYY